MLKKLSLAACLLALTAGQSFAQEPSRGGTLNMIVQPEPPTLMMGIGRVAPVFFVASKIFEGLITLAPDMTPLPMLAESWETSEDGLTYTFNLRKGVKWHDGQPFTSADVVYSFTHFLPEAVSRVRTVMKKVESVEAPNDHTVVFTLKEPYAAFMMMFEVSDSPIMARHIYEGTKIFDNPANEKPVGTGPFVFDKWERGQYIHLVRNEAYWKENRPYLDELYFQVVPDANSRAIAFEQGQVDVLRGGDVENFEVKRLSEMPGVEVSEKGWEFFDPIAIINLNMRNPPLDNVKVRQAISYAYDRQFVIEAVFGGFGKPTFGPMTDRTPFYDGAVLSDYSFNMDKARQLMAESGLKPDADGIYAKLDLTPLPYGEAWQRQGEYLRQQLRQIGIETNVISVDVAGWSERVTTGKFDITTNYIFLRGDPAVGVEQTYVSHNQFGRGGGANLGGYENPQVDELFLKASQAVKRDDRKGLYSQLQEIISRESPIVWSHQMSFPTVYRSKVKNLITSGIGLNDNFSEVWIGE